MAGISGIGRKPKYEEGIFVFGYETLTDPVAIATLFEKAEKRLFDRGSTPDLWAQQLTKPLALHQQSHN